MRRFVDLAAPAGIPFSMRRFIARAKGGLIGNAPWMGRVLSVHARAFNILREDGLAVSVVADRSSMSAMGVLAPELFETPPDAKLVDVAARMEDAVISFDALASIDCAECPAWDGGIDAATARVISVERIRAIRDSLFVHGKPGGLLGILRNGPAENAFVVRARDSLEAGRPEDLVGCGPGLTPAGDDFLTGAILASHLAFSLASLASPVFGHARLWRALAGTTPAGRTLLWMALQNRFPAYLVDFINAIAGAAVSADAIVRSVRVACAHGETSGTDALAGFCWQMLSSATSPLL
ncbi:MAG: DUF2877 domain-containing protein [Spirochaetes bacterium]|nr:DUF2877 domain-containing protein [Spirochaetota bacterium]